LKHEYLSIAKYSTIYFLSSFKYYNTKFIQDKRYITNRIIRAKKFIINHFGLFKCCFEFSNIYRFNKNMQDNVNTDYVNKRKTFLIRTAYFNIIILFLINLKHCLFKAIHFENLIIIRV
jgi:hypothetical protein